MRTVMPYREAAGPDIATKVAHLASGREFKLGDRPVAVIETHTSWVFMGRSTVLKLKKPVRFPFLDLSTTERRRHNCESELRLNRRLAPGVYRRILPLRVDSSGRMATQGDGRIVDWLVEMRRLPADRMLDALSGAASSRSRMWKPWGTASCNSTPGPALIAIFSTASAPLLPSSRKLPK
jgi:hypothetical protein